MFSAPLQRFQVSLPPSNIVFNRDVALDLIRIENKAVLNVVDIGTGFNSVMFLSYQTVENLCDAIVICLSSLYIGVPVKICVDQRSS